MSKQVLKRFLVDLLGKERLQEGFEIHRIYWARSWTLDAFHFSGKLGRVLMVICKAV